MSACGMPAPRGKRGDGAAIDESRDGRPKACRMLPIFRAQDVHREAVAALFLFHEAVREVQVTVVFIRELASYLDAARHDPSLRFRGR